MDDYETLLNSAYEKMPEVVVQKERFEVPKVRGHLQGNRTILTNFTDIAKRFNRPPEHMLKFILKELATPGEIKKAFVIFGTKIPASRINEKIEQYAEMYVICKDCGKPDTKLSKEGDILFMKCMACGSRHVVKTRI
jgi:translation initiation factor 2 subunit 2